MPALNRKLKVVTFTLGATEYQAQLSAWNLENNTDDPTIVYVFAEGQQFAEDADDSYALSMTFFSDWRSAGISDFLWTNNGTDVAFVLDHHPDIPAERVRWAGTVRIKAPNVGGDVRTTEVTEVTLQCVGKPVYSRP